MYFKKFLILSILTLNILSLNAQDVEASVTVIHPKVQVTNTQIFTSLQNSILQFVNQRLWCEDKITIVERIKMTILIDVTSYDMNTYDFNATIQIQATRPVFGSTYSTVIFNQLDNEFSFRYQEFQAMEFQPNANVYNLTGVLAYYVNTVVGLVYDSQTSEGGTPYYMKAKEIVNASQSMSGWRPNDGVSLKNRYHLIDNILSNRFLPLRKAYFSYHLNGLDLMHKDVDKGRDEIYKALESFQDVCKQYPNSMLVKVFFNSKYKELIEIFKGAPAAEQLKAMELLSAMDPSNKANYDKIKT